MTAQEIADRLVKSDKGITAERLKKAHALCQRMKVEFTEMLVYLNKKQRAKVESLQ